MVRVFHFCTVQHIFPKHLLGFSLLSLLLCAMVIFVHFWPGNNSMLNLHSWDHMNGKKGLNEAYLVDVVEYHKEEPAFRARPVTTFLVEKTAQISGLSVGWSFTVINFLFLWMGGILVSLLAFQVTKTPAPAYYAQLAFWLSFPILFAFFPMIYSYDDSLQYVLILIALIFLSRKNLIGFTVVFTTSLLVRESGLILLPGILWITYDFNARINSGKNLKTLAILVLPVMAYYTFAFFYAQHLGIADELKETGKNRLVCFGENFRDQQFGIESIVSFVLVSLLALVTWPKFREQNKTWSQAFMITLVLNTIVVLLFTKARESRLFIMPLFFWLPFAGQLLANEAIKIGQNFKLQPLKMSFWVLCFVIMAAYIGLYIYQPTGMKPFNNWHQEYLVVLLIFAGLIWHNPKQIKT